MKVYENKPVRRMSESFVAEGLRLAKGASVYGMPLDEMNLYEAVACLAKLGVMHGDMLEENSRQLGVMSKMRK